jgi:hypothetical protein
MLRQDRVVASLVLLLLLGGLHPSAARANNLSCLVCHNALKGTFTTEAGVETSLHVDGDRYAASVHRDLECTTCHMRFVDNPHNPIDEEIDEEILALSEAIANKSRIDPVAQAACVQCHDEIYAQVRSSVHGVNILTKKEVDGPLCVDCHGSAHEIVARGALAEGAADHSPVAYDNVVETCGTCHEKKSVSLKYGFSTKIIATYDESFHGKKYHLGGKDLPVCTTCHGAHDVRSQTDPEARIYGENRIALCGQCHEGANQKFVAAITHRPLGKDNPIPYYAEKGLILLTFLVISACVLHVLLDIYAMVRISVQVRRRNQKK